MATFIGGFISVMAEGFGHSIVLILVASALTFIFSKSKGATIVTAVVSSVVLSFIAAANQPSWSLDFVGPFFLTAIAIAIACVVPIALDECSPEDMKVPGIIFLVVILSFFGRGCVQTSNMFNAADYHKMVEVEEVDFGKMPPADIDHMRLVPKYTAISIAKTALDSSNGDNILSSQVQIDKSRVSIRFVEGRFWWIIPVDFTGYGKYLRLGKVPGYIRVSAEDPKAPAELIEKTKAGEEIGMRVTPAAWFDDNLDRVLWRRYKNFERGYINFTVDDNWKPWYVVPLMRPSIGFAGQEVIKVVLLDPATGDVEEYAPDKTPSWVERIIPEDIAVARLGWWGQFGDKEAPWLNSWLYEKNIQKPTGGEAWAINFGNQIYWFSGMTSPNRNDNTLIGVAMMDTRTGKVLYSKMGGATDEEGAVDAVRASLGAEAGQWRVVDPIPYLIYGEGSWFIQILGDDGTIQRSAFVWMKDKRVKGVGSTVQEALTRYRVALSQGASMSVGNEEMAMSELSGIVVETGIRAVDGMHFIRLKGDKRAFGATAETDKTFDMIFVEKGDGVTVKFFDTGDKIVMVDEIVRNSY